MQQALSFNSDDCHEKPANDMSLVEKYKRARDQVHKLDIGPEAQRWEKLAEEYAAAGAVAHCRVCGAEVAAHFEWVMVWPLTLDCAFADIGRSRKQRETGEDTRGDFVKLKCTGVGQMGREHAHGWIFRDGALRKE